MTSVEVASVENDNAGERPVTFTVANVGGEWIITAFDMRDADEDGERKIYADPANGFTLRYPEGMFAVLSAGEEDAVRAGHYIPPCDDGFAACFVYSADTYATTNLDGAGVGVFITDAADMQLQEDLHSVTTTFEVLP